MTSCELLNEDCVVPHPLYLDDGRDAVSLDAEVFRFGCAVFAQGVHGQRRLESPRDVQWLIRSPDGELDLLAWQDTPEERGLLALYQAAEDLSRFSSLALRLTALAHLLRAEQIKPWADLVDDQVCPECWHPAVFEVAGSLELDVEGDFSPDRFRMRLAQLASTEH